LLSLPNAAISVGHTKVKSFGQKNTTFHLPSKLLSVSWANSLPASRETTAWALNVGNLSPMVSMYAVSFDAGRARRLMPGTMPQLR
jgi:hypothetical protein